VTKRMRYCTATAAVRQCCEGYMRQLTLTAIAQSAPAGTRGQIRLNGAPDGSLSMAYPSCFDAHYDHDVIHLLVFERFPDSSNKQSPRPENVGISVT
jgi:hypothetical protein